MNSRLQAHTLALLLGPAIACHAHAETYLSENEAPSAIFPGRAFEKKALELSQDEADKIEKAADEKVRSKTLVVYRAKSGESVFIDQVLGKHEFITYAVGVDANGKVGGIEILEYKESYGSQVRKPEWRQQFVGKDKSAKLKLGDDIKNLSGATLSSAHLSAGVRRVLQTYEIVRARL